MNKKQVIQKTRDYVKEKFSEEHTGHDWWHIQRVRTLAKKIASERHRFMEKYLKQFFAEWEGRK